MRKTTCVIVEDEVQSQKLLKGILEDFCPDVEVLGIASSVDEGIELLRAVDCEVVFMDIQLDDRISFEILETLAEWNFDIIFTTAYDNYALKAFKVEAVDYLLKPYSPKEVRLAIEKSKTRRLRPSLSKFREIFQAETKANHKISLSTSEGVHLIDISSIQFVNADGSYCLVHTAQGDRIIVSKSLTDIEQQLNNGDFMRVHASFLVSKLFIRRYLKEDGGIIEMQNGITIPVSRRKKNEFLEWIK